MKYLAAILSLIIHILIILILCKNIFIINENVFSLMNVELVNIPDQKKLVTKSEHKQEIESKTAPIAKKSQSTSSKYQSAVKDAPVSKVRKSGSVRKNIVKADPVPVPNKNAIVLKQGKQVTVGNSTIALKRGSEGRTFDSMAAYSFGEDDFGGHYETETGRSVVVIDARQEHGRLILHDKRTGLTRKLKKAGYGDFIYTYGPSFDEDMPIEGSVTFLPGDGQWIRRFMWLPGDEAAEYPMKGRVTAVKDAENRIGTDFFVPKDKGIFPAVIIVRFGMTIPDDQFSEVARHLAAKGAVVYVASTCTSDSLKKVVAGLRKLKDVDPARVGVWLRGYRPETIPNLGSCIKEFNFAVITIDKPDKSIHAERLVGLIPDDIPVFAGFRGVNREWKEMILLMFSGLQSVPNQLVVLNTASTFRKAGTDLESFDSLSGDFVSSISAWLVSR